MKLGLAAILVFGAFVGAMAWSQDDLIFPVHAVGPPGPLPAGAERLSLDLPGGERLHGVHISPSRAETGPTTLILGFGGNAWNGEDVGSYLHDLFPDAHVVAFHYRGYRPSTGRPSAQALVGDAPLVLNAAIERVNPDRTIAVGFSIGSAVAASLAGSGEVGGLILVTPFDSMKAVARSLYPWLPIDLLFRHEFDTVGFLQGSDVPAAIVAAGRDEIIPVRRTGALRAAMPNLVYDRTIEGAGHNDIYMRSQFQDAMREAFESLIR